MGLGGQRSGVSTLRARQRLHPDRDFLGRDLSSTHDRALTPELAGPDASYLIPLLDGSEPSQQVVASVDAFEAVFARKRTQVRHWQAEAARRNVTTQSLCQERKTALALAGVEGSITGSVDSKVVFEAKDDPDGEDGTFVVPGALRTVDKIGGKLEPSIEVHLHNHLLALPPAERELENLLLPDVGSVCLKRQEGEDHRPGQAELAKLGGVREAKVPSHLLFILLDRDEGNGMVWVPGTLDRGRRSDSEHPGSRDGAVLFTCQ